MRLLILAASALVTFPAAAQTSPLPHSTPAPSASEASASVASTAVAAVDHEFVAKATAAGMAEVELGKLAEQRAQNDKVKRFAMKMVADHDKANKELIGLAQGLNMTQPAASDPKNAEVRFRLEQAPTTDFDSEYMKARLLDQMDVVALFEKQAREGKNEALKEFAFNTLPTLREHLRLTEELVAKLPAHSN
jgi:putative membrane protein